MKVAALLVNYRDAAGTAAAAASVRADDAATEIVVVDNSDDDAHWQALRRALPEGAQAVRAPANLGFGRGCNLAMRHTDAPLLMLVNPDLRLRPGCIAALREALLADARLAAVAPRQFLDEACTWKLPPAWLPTALRGWATEAAARSPRWHPRWARAIRAENLRCWQATRPIAQRALSGGAMLVRRAALRGPAGGDASAAPLDPDELFDPRFFMYFEDADLCLRLRRNRWRLGLVPAAQAVHAWRNAPHKAALMQQGMQTFVDKHVAPDDRWQARRTGSAAATPLGRVEPLIGTRLSIGAAAGEAWCLEISPHPNLWPAVGHLGHGAVTLELGPVLDALAGGASAWLRLAGLDPEPGASARRWRWDAPASALSAAAGGLPPSAAAR